MLIKLKDLQNRDNTICDFEENYYYVVVNNSLHSPTELKNV